MRQGCRRGQALVELALTLPLFFAVLVGIVQVGVLFHRQLILTDSAREGARLAALGTSETRIRERLAPLMGQQTTLRVITEGDAVTVTLQEPPQALLVPGLAPAVLAASTTMRRE